MIVVADTTPLCHLVWIGADELLARLFGEVHIPELVMAELRAEGAPENVRAWAGNPPEWLRIHPNTTKPARLAEVQTIDAGEREALALALELQASLVLVDDRTARRVAAEFGLAITGTLGLLERAARMQFVDFEQSVTQLRATGFWMRESTVEEIRQRLRGTEQ